MLGHDCEQRFCITDTRDDFVPRVLEQAREPFAQQDGVLGDHDPHGNSTSIRVPTPSGLLIRNVPPWAATRSVSPTRPGSLRRIRAADAVVGDQQP